MENIIKKIVMHIKITYRGYKQSLLSKRLFFKQSEFIILSKFTFVRGTCVDHKARQKH